MDDIERRIRHTLGLVRGAIRALEADPEAYREAVERSQNATSRPVPLDTPDVCLGEIERILAGALERLEAMED